MPCVVTGWDSTTLDVVQRLKDLVRLPVGSVQQPHAVAERSEKGEDIVDSESDNGDGDTQWCSGDDTDSEYASEVETRRTMQRVKKHKESTGLPSLLVGSPKGSQSGSSSLLLSPVDPSKLQEKQEGGSLHEDTDQTSLEVSDCMASDASLNAEVKQQCVTPLRKRANKSSIHDVSSSDKKRSRTCKPSSGIPEATICPHTEDVIDLTLSPSCSNSSVEAFGSPLNCGSGNPDSQGSCQSWLPATPDVNSTIRTIAFEDI